MDLVRISNIPAPRGAAVYLLFSLQHEVKLDWTGTVWIAAVPALACAAHGRVRTAWATTLVFLLLLYGVGLDYLVLGFPGAGYSEHMKVSPVGWRDLGRQVSTLADDVRRKSGSDPLLVALKPQDVVDPAIAPHGTRLEPPAAGVLLRNGRVIHRFYYRVVFGYR